MDNASITAERTRKSKYYFTALEVLEFICTALQLRYDYRIVKKKLIDILGPNRIQKMRTRGKLDKEGIKLLEEACRTGFRTVETLLDKMGDNEADIYWKSQLAVVS